MAGGGSDNKPDRLHRLSTWLGLIASIIGILGFFGYATATDFFGTSSSSPTSTYPTYPTQTSYPDSNSGGSDGSSTSTVEPSTTSTAGSNSTGDYYGQLSGVSLVRYIASMLVIEDYSVSEVDCPGGLDEVGDSQQCVAQTSSGTLVLDITATRTSSGIELLVNGVPI
jgi:hypothetical protein